MKSLAFFILLAFAFSGYGQSASDTAAQIKFEGIQHIVDSVSTSLSNGKNQQANQQARKIKIIKKDIPYSTFVSLAMGMIVFIALILTTTANYNPSE
jgi:hypothetical protein